jgi:putative hydrolase of HD superfamily
MIRKPLLLKIYEAASMQRWNDQIRIVELTELDKQAHKMIVAYVLGKCEEDINGKDIDWIKIIETGLFEFLQRIVLTDLKPPLFHKIKENNKEYRQLNQWVFNKISPIISHLGDDFCKRFESFLMSDEEDINQRIVDAAHFYVTKWEFDIIKRGNPSGYQNNEISKSIQLKQEKYSDLKSMKKILGSKQLTDFVNICGQLRFQIRWSHLYRVPKTSVLGHMLIVAILSYLFSYLTKADRERCVNNYFTGLFHDLPEVLTRDIINPVKKSVEGLYDIIKEYEQQEMEKKIYKLIPKQWHSDIRMFTEDEFSNTDVRDGELVKGADDLAAFIEAYLSLNNGIQNEDMLYAKISLSEKYKSKIISGINFGEIYADFD